MTCNRSLLIGCVLLCATLLSSCQTQNEERRELTVLYTNDEHGWMEGMEAGRGAANLRQLWEDREGYSEASEENFLVLSGGDNWTGPAISTWNQGESMVEVMNTMGYAASAIGNHEFDFGLDTVRQRSAEADYAYLSANTVWRSTNRVPEDLGIHAYRMATAGGIRVGIVGLTARDTVTTTNPANVASLNFVHYEKTLREIVPQVEAQGAELVLVISHVCLEELEPLIDAVVDLGIDLFGAGHCNELVAARRGEAVVLGGGFHFGSYARATLSITDGDVKLSEFATRKNEGAEADPATQGIVKKWREQSESSLSEVLAHTAEALPRGPQLDQLVIDSWLFDDPTAQVALTNAGGIRAPLPRGELTLGDTVAILPFDNTIVALRLRGEDLVAALEEGARPRAAGLLRVGDEWRIAATGGQIDPAAFYRVLVNSFMYAGGDNYGRLKLADPEGYDTGIQYGDPFRHWLRSQRSSAENPLQF